MHGLRTSGARFFSGALFGAVVIASAGASERAEAADGCDALPTAATKLVEVREVTDASCNVGCGDWPAVFPRPPAPLSAGSAIAPGGPKIEFVDTWHGACQVKLGSGTVCKTDTVCPGRTRIQDGGVWKCEGKKLETQTFNPRQDCKTGAVPPIFKYDSTAAAVDALKRAKEILFPAGTKDAGTRQCAWGGTSVRTFKGQNLHLVDALKTDDPAISGFLKTSGTPLPNEVTFEIYARPNARIGAHSFELSGLNGKQTVKVENVGVVENDSTQTTCPTRSVYPGMKTTRTCVAGQPCP